MVAASPADDVDRAGEAELSGPEVDMKGGGDITKGVGLRLLTVMVLLNK